MALTEGPSLGAAQTTKAPKQSAIGTALVRVQKSNSGLETAVFALIDTLLPVLAPSVPTDMAANPERVPSSDLADALHREADKTAVLADIVRNVTERVEL